MQVGVMGLWIFPPFVTNALEGDYRCFGLFIAWGFWTNLPFTIYSR